MSLLRGPFSTIEEAAESCGDNCTGWYCCQEKTEVVFFTNCEEMSSYSCSSSTATIGTTCCPNPLPQVITITFTTTNCAILSGYTFQMIYAAELSTDTVTVWNGSGLRDGIGVSGTVACNDGSWGFGLTGNCFPPENPGDAPPPFFFNISTAFSMATPTFVSCDPFSVVYTGLSTDPGSSCCDSAGDIAITFTG